jgi:hypothetical protein
MGIIKLPWVITLALIIPFSVNAQSSEYSGPVYRQGVNDVTVVSGYAYCATAEGLMIIDISTPQQMPLISEYSTPEGASAVGIYKNYALLTAWDSGLDIIDISNPRKPSLAANFSVDGYACGIFIKENYAYLAYGHSGLQIVDIADPAHPKQDGTLDVPGFAFKVIVAGKYAFVHDLNNGILIVDISIPTKPKLVNSYNAQTGISDFYVSDGRLYIAVRNTGLSIVDYSDIHNLRQIGAFEYPSIENLSIYGNDVICAGGANSSEIKIISLNEVDKPRPLGTLNTQTWNKKIFIKETAAYIAGCSGLLAIDISDPARPVISGTHDLRPVLERHYGVDPYISLPGETRPSITDYNQDGRDFVLQDDDVYVAGRAGETDAWQAFFMKADTSGTEDFSHDYGPWTVYDAAFCLTGTSDGDFVMGGKVQPSPGRTNDDILLQKVNASGDSLWHHQYDLAGTAYDGNGFDRLWDIIELPDGDLIGCGTVTTRDFPIDPLVLPESHKDAGLLRFNSLGDISWVQNYGSTTSTETARACIATSDNGLVFTGYAGYRYNNKNQIYVVKTDMAGGIIWERTYGDPQKWHIGYWVEEADDGNYIVAGETETTNSVDGLVMKISSDEGDIIWQKVYGGPYYDSFANGLITESGDILLVGYKTVDGLETSVPWLVRIDANGYRVCEIDASAGEISKFYIGLRGPIEDRYIFTGNSMDPYDVFIGGSDLSECEPVLYFYLPGDANMDGKNTGNDVTYLVNYFRSAPTSIPCYFNGDAGLLWASADANGSCDITGNDVTKMVNYNRSDPTAPALLFCPQYQPAYPTSADVPNPLPEGWPFCENPFVTGTKIIPISPTE